EKAKAESLMMEQKVFKVKASQEEQKVSSEMNSFEINIQRLVEKLEDEKRMMREQIERLMSEKRRGSAQQEKLYAAQISDLEKEQVNETARYEPIWENFKSVAVELSPRLLSFGAEVVKTDSYQNKGENLPKPDNTHKEKNLPKPNNTPSEVIGSI
ncbi:hypothetical protein XELAEV_180016483mg, partial [Xenopus laevis]